MLDGISINHPMHLVVSLLLTNRDKRFLWIFFILAPNGDLMEPDENYPRLTEKDFISLYREYIHILLHFAKGIVYNQADAEDICASVFVTLWERRETLTNTSNIKGYLYIATRNACISFLRTRQRRPEEHGETEHLDSAVDPNYLLTDVRSLYLENIRREVRQLPEQRRRVLELAYFEERTNGDIAALLGISIQSVYTLKNRALQQLRLAETKAKITRQVFSVFLTIIILIRFL
jgi:RNA polymerase sigma-70 factor (ECF subfamily)